MNYEVTYLTVNGCYSQLCSTLQEAKDYAATVKGLKAAGVKVSKVTA